VEKNRVEADLSAVASAKAEPKDVFLHLLSIIALYVSVGSLIALLFQYVNVLLPDPLSGGGYYRLQSAFSSIRWSIASLIVIFPVYVWASRVLHKSYVAMPERSNFKIRKWLVYLTLFAAALFIIGDLMALIFNFLEGELTIRFLLKVFTILIVAASVFWYYWLDLKSKAPHKVFAYATSTILLVAVIAGFFIVGSPQEGRLRRFDEQRVQNLQFLQSEIVSFWINKERLPKSLLL